MKKIFILLCFLLLFSCSNSKKVYWCGDHACINNKEKEAYFKKTMIVEIKEIKRKKKRKTDIEKIITQDKKNTKVKEDYEIIEENNTFDEKELAKQAKLDEKRRIKKEKELAKQAKIDKKKISKETVLEKELEKVIIEEDRNSTKEIVANENNDINSNKFRSMAERILKKNSSKSYPDINNVPN